MSETRAEDSFVPAAGVGVRGLDRCAPGASHGAIKQAFTDFCESCVRVANDVHMPTRDGVLAFFGNQVLVNAVAWTAGVLAAWLVKRFFEVRGFGNLWGLTASAGRSVVSADDYRIIMGLASYSAGLLMLILVRHLIIRLVAEFQALRLERARGDGRRSVSTRGRGLDGLELVLDDPTDG